MKFIFDRKKISKLQATYDCQKTKPKYILAIFYIYYLVQITLFVYSTKYIWILLNHPFLETFSWKLKKY